MQKIALIFEGGAPPQNDLQAAVAAVRRAATLDAVERYRRCGLDEVVLVTNFADLAAEAVQLGARVWDSSGAEPFHFGRVLQRIVAELKPAGVLYTSGGALPLITDEEVRWILQAMETAPPCVVVNNLQSIDLAAWSPADHVLRIEPPASDNFLGWLLREQGMERILIPNSAGIHFDLDTPTDFLILAVSGLGGPRVREAVKALPWRSDRLLKAADVLARDLPEVALIGRVGTPVIDHVNKYLRVRLRVFSEERGMKALGRVEEGRVVSVMAGLMEDLGPERFFRRLEEVCSAVFFDTRVAFAHGGRRVSEWDRFHSDLGLVERIEDPWVRRFTEAALASRIPVVLGGHSVVSGGLWVLADRAIAARGGPRVSQAKGFARV